MDWFVYTYNNGEFLRILFNGIVLIMGQGGYANLILLSGQAALIWVAINSAVLMRPIDFTWLVSFILVYNALFLPKVDVVIVDRLDPSQSAAVGNMPLGFGVFVSVFSQIGDTLTTWAETVNTLPDDLRYQRNGVVMASSLIEAAAEFEITDPDFNANLSEFMQQCVFFDVLLGHYTWNELLAAPDLWGFLSANASPAQAFRYNQSILTCREGAASLTNDWTMEIDRAAGIYGMRFNPNLNLAAAKAKLLSDLPLSYDYLAAISQTGADLIRQNMMVNLFRRSLLQQAASANASAAAQDFALAQADAQRRSAYATIGKIAAKVLPLLKNIFEGLLYGAFPFLFLVFLLPVGGKAILLYLQNLAWLQFWAPLYSILNLLMTLYGAKVSSAAVADSTGATALTLQTATGLSQTNADMAVMAGYMAISIPLIAYGLIRGGGFAFAQLASQLGAVGQSYAMQASSQVATGNMNLGNIGAYNTSMFQHNTAPSHISGVATYNDPGTGATYTATQGGTFVNIPQHHLPISASIQGSVQETVTHQAGQRLETAKSNVVSYSDTAGETYSQMHQYLDSMSKTQSTSVDWSRTEAAAFQREAGKLQGLVEGFHGAEGITNTDKVRVLAAASVSAQTPNILPVSIQGKLGGERGNEVDYQEVSRQAKDYTERTNFGEQFQKTIDAAHRAVASGALSSGDTYTEQLNDQLNRQLQLREQTASSLTEASNWQQLQSEVEAKGVSFSAVLEPLVRQAMLDDGFPERGPGSVDSMFSRIGSGQEGSHIDQEVIARYTQKTIEKYGLDLAGIDVQDINYFDQTKNSIQHQNQVQQQDLREAGDNSAVNLHTDAEASAVNSGLNTEIGIDRAKSDVVEQVESDKQSFENQVDTGDNTLTQEGSQLQDKVTERKDFAKSFFKGDEAKE